MSEDANPRAPVGPSFVKGYRYPRPIGRTEVFVEAVRAARGAKADSFIAAWLSARTCQFEDCVIWTHDQGVQKLIRFCGDLIKTHKIAVKADARSREHFRDNVMRA